MEKHDPDGPSWRLKFGVYGVAFVIGWIVVVIRSCGT